MLFYFSDLEFPATASIEIIIISIILVSPILVFYWVFRNSTKRKKEYEFFRGLSEWLSLACVANLIICFCFIKLKVIAANPELMLLVLILSAAGAFIFGIISLPRWQGFLAVSCYVLYCLYFITL